ncbi:MAG: barstar family protein [Betaproteobacteria bacterium]|nr:barstar family protein [Betaproteobacteria bacterium]
MTALEARLRDTARAGPYLAPNDLRALADAVRKSDLTLLRLDIKGVRDKRDLLAAIAAALEFPEWFGGNWDALEERLTELPCNQTHGFVLLLDHCAEFARHSPNEFAAAIEIFESAAEFWAEQDKVFWTLFGGIKTPVAGIRPLT